MQGFFFLLLVAALAACSSPAPSPLTPSPILPTFPAPPATRASPPAPTETGTVSPSPTSALLIPDFGHIVIIIFENREFGLVIDNPNMPTYNRFARGGTLLTQYYAPTHPSLPNYLALIGGDTFGVTSDCNDCFINAPSLPDPIETSGRTWKTYQEDLPEPCFIGDRYPYAQKHDPFIYFDPIRMDEARCKRSIVPLTDLEADMNNGTLPDFAFIVPNLCNSGHDCNLGVVDAWLARLMENLLPALSATGEPYLVVLTWDEGQGSHSCCGLPAEAGGRVATVLISPQAKSGFEDDTPYTHYSLLKTIAESWGLPYLAHAADDSNVLIERPFQP
jgi:phospholipase C